MSANAGAASVGSNDGLTAPAPQDTPEVLLVFEDLTLAKVVGKVLEGVGFRCRIPPPPGKKHAERQHGRSAGTAEAVRRPSPPRARRCRLRCGSGAQPGHLGTDLGGPPGALPREAGMPVHGLRTGEGNADGVDSVDCSPVLLASRAALPDDRRVRRTAGGFTHLIRGKPRSRSVDLHIPSRPVIRYNPHHVFSWPLTLALPNLLEERYRP